MTLEKMQTKESGVENDLERINQMIEDIRSQAQLIETIKDVHEVLKKVNGCNTECLKLEHEQAQEKRKELINLSETVLNQLKKFEKLQREEKVESERIVAEELKKSEELIRESNECAKETKQAIKDNFIRTEEESLKDEDN